jgi:GT2 family glycosyltransferase
MSLVTAVIVTYNSGAHLSAAVASCRQFGIPVVIVDNASTDGTVFPGDVTVLRNEANRGFAAAVNQGVRAHRSPLTLLLNPDARLLTGPLFATFALLTDTPPRPGYWWRPMGNRRKGSVSGGYRPRRHWFVKCWG